MELKKGIKSLNSALYGNHQNGNSLEELKNDFCGMSFAEIKNKKNDHESMLPPLYPEKK